MELKTVQIERVVQQENLACTMKSGSLEVLATPQMIAWMEEAACLCLELEQQKTSVGISMNVSHDMASPLGATILIEAKMMHVDGRKIDYEVQAFQDGKSIGKGVHSRFIVDAEKFIAKTYKK
jgi:fluoroacetyl-CoA thioesterase